MSNITIALADDHAILRKGLISILNSYDNIEVIADADNGKELIDKLGTLNKLPDIAILDINMPVMDGYAATRHISSHWKTVKILALSMYDDEECVIKMLRCGANGYVLKDINPDMLRDALAHLKTNQYYYSDHFLLLPYSFPCSKYQSFAEGGQSRLPYNNPEAGAAAVYRS